MDKIHQYIMPLFFIGLLGFFYGVIYFLEWDHEHSVSEWLTVILYIAAIFYYLRYNEKHFGIFPVLVIFLILVKELDWLKFAFVFFDALPVYKNFWKDPVWRAIIFSPLIVVIIADMVRVRNNIVIFLRQKRYLYFLVFMAALGAATQIIDKTRGSVPVWASFEEAGETVLPIMLLVMFYMLKSETCFEEHQERHGAA